VKKIKASVELNMERMPSNLKLELTVDGEVVVLQEFLGDKDEVESEIVRLLQRYLEDQEEMKKEVEAQRSILRNIEEDAMIEAAFADLTEEYQAINDLAVENDELETAIFNEDEENKL
jgi:hypothetical protein